MKFKTSLTAFLAGLALLHFTACDPAKKNDSTEVAKGINAATLEDRKDRKNADFVVNTVSAGYAEIKYAQLALTRSKDEEVKSMATQLVADHTKVINELNAYAIKNSITVPFEESDESKEAITKFTEKDAKEFDKDWCNVLQDNHEKSISSFETRLERTEDPELKGLIVATLPVLRSHLEMLKAHESKLK